MVSTVDNRVQLIGYLGQEIEIRELAEDKKFARMSMATHESKKEDGKRITITTWHNLVAWGKTAETMQKVFSKGQRLFVEGKLAYRQYTNAEGQQKQITEIEITDFKRLEPYDKN